MTTRLAAWTGSHLRAASPGRARAFRPGRLPAARDGGMATAEYAIVTLAAAGFAGLLLLLIKSDQIRGLVLGLITKALGIGG